MPMSVGSLFTLYRFTPGRRVWMLSMIRKAAGELGLTSVVGRCDALLPAEEQLTADYRTWTEVRSDAAGTETSQALVGLDQTRDGLLGGFDTTLQTQSRLSGRKSGKAAAKLATKLFPEGSRPIITLPYPDETAAIDALVKLAQGELAGDVADASAADWVEDLAAANAAFKTAYNALTERRQVDWKDIRAKDADAQERFLVLVAHVVDTTFGSPAFAALVDPIDVQQAAMKALYQSRKIVVDIDPKTGDPLPEPVTTGSTTPIPPT